MYLFLFFFTVLLTLLVDTESQTQVSKCTTGCCWVRTEECPPVLLSSGFGMPGPSERTLEPSAGRCGEWRMGGGY